MVSDHVAEARDLLVELLRRRRKVTAGMFDFEPLEVLYSMTRNEQWPTIGGSVRIVKVYRSLNAVPFVVRDTESGVLSLLGRPLLSYETPDRFPLLEIVCVGLFAPAALTCAANDRRRMAVDALDRFPGRVAIVVSFDVSMWETAR
jgi:hypothetical protein